MERICKHCAGSIPEKRKKAAIYCCRKCQESAFRLRTKDARADPVNVSEGKECLYCEKPIVGKWKRHAKYCSRRCQSDAYNQNITGSRKLNLPTATIGAMSELMVAVDLLSKGFEVFRALSPSCSCDLAVLKNGQLLRIEVRTGRRMLSGKTFCAFKPSDAPRSDILAMIIPDENFIEYRPALERARPVGAANEPPPSAA